MSEQSPNIIMIVTDQQRRDTLRCYDPNTLCQTPNLDALAADSVVFDNAYTTCPVCTPARASLQTGMYPFKHGMQTNTYTLGCIVNELPDSPGLLSRQLQRHTNYSIGHTGKWHLGQGPVERSKFDRNLKHVAFPDIMAGHRSLPSDVGYEGDDFPGHGGGGWNYPQFRKYLADAGLELKIEHRISGHYEGHFAAEVTSPVETTIEHYLTNCAMFHMERFLERERPFMMGIHYWGPHEPYIAPSSTLDLYRNISMPPWQNFQAKEVGKPLIHDIKRSPVTDWSVFEPFVKHYYASMTHIDAQIGRIVDFLKQRGIYENTVIMFCADHGESLGIHGGLCDKGFFMYDETCRIPLLIKPSHGQPASRRESAMAGMCDLYATVLDCAGVHELPAGTDGRSLLPFIEGKEVDDWPESVVTEGAGLGGVMFTQRMIRRGDYKYVFNCGDIDELYNLRDDPHELVNLVGHTSYADMLADMRQALASWMKEHDDSLLIEFVRMRLRDK
ncbi:sulfatase-like hydrolase/transferase [Paenibacillus sp. OSY-SE]|uniref:sulfatase-like hydrolase/transferase n=1 Tax=Paenibacillus sp. OSY-SE TaxID=1196323 RepID=UPI0002DDA9F5|nr:sulfatase-like hydrolase/transferase [Paenibacillus sp. OSY-SE]